MAEKLPPLTEVEADMAPLVARKVRVAGCVVGEETATVAAKQAQTGRCIVAQAQLTGGSAALHQSLRVLTHVVLLLCAHVCLRYTGCGLCTPCRQQARHLG